MNDVQKRAFLEDFARVLLKHLPRGTPALVIVFDPSDGEFHMNAPTGTPVLEMLRSAIKRAEENGPDQNITVKPSDVSS